MLHVGYRVYRLLHVALGIQELTSGLRFYRALGGRGGGLNSTVGLKAKNTGTLEKALTPKTLPPSPPICPFFRKGSATCTGDLKRASSLIRTCWTLWTRFAFLAPKEYALDPYALTSTCSIP